MINIFTALRRIADAFPDTGIIYPVHLSPAVQVPARRILSGHPSIHLLPPVDYADMAYLLKHSYCVLTDSGGLQEEAPALGKPVLVVRQVTERPEAVRAGTVRIIGTDETRVYTELHRLLSNKKAYRAMAVAVNPYGDGKAVMRTVEAVRFWWKLRRDRPRPFTGG